MKKSILISSKQISVENQSEIQQESQFSQNYQQPSAKGQSEKIEDHFMINMLSKLTKKVDDIEIKLFSLTNLVKLVQQYTEKKDIQYEKQKQNCKHIQETHQSNSLHEEVVQNRIKNIEITMKKIHQEMSQIDKQIKEKQKLKTDDYKEKEIFSLKSYFTSNLSDFEEKYNFEIDELSKKINKIETIFLKQKRQESQNEGKQITNREIDELKFITNKIQNDMKNFKAIIERKVEGLMEANGELKKQNYSNEYGLGNLSKSAKKLNQKKRQDSKSSRKIRILEEELAQKKRKKKKMRTTFE